MPINNLKDKFNLASVVEKIIYINIVVFILTFLINSLSFLFKADGNFVLNWFALTPHFDNLIIKPWTLISYGFLHSGFFHILFNLLVLFYIGNLFLDFFSKKQFLVYYFFGIIFGALIYILSYNYLPALKTQNSLLVGASAGITSVLIGLAVLIPNYALRFRFIGNIKLQYIALAFVVLDVIQIPDGNAGGHLAHIGGALIGFVLTRYFNQAQGISQWFENLLIKKNKETLKTVYKNKRKKKTVVKNTKDQQIKIDRILDKISKSGYETLTKEEKDFLFKVGKN